MDEVSQVRAILDKLRGVPAEDLPEAGALEEPWRTIYGRVRGCGDREEASVLIVGATLGLAPELSHLPTLPPSHFPTSQPHPSGVDIKNR